MLRLAACATAAVSAIVHLIVVGEPLGDDIEGLTTGKYIGVVQQNYEKGGFAAMRGEPRLYALPTTPPSGPPYVNHPPLLHWTIYPVVRALGVNELALRLPSTIASALCAALLTLIVGRALGVSFGIVGGLSFVAAPMTFFYGRMAGFEPFVLLCGLAGSLVLTRTPPGRRDELIAGTAVFAATLFDWPGVFLVPAFAIMLIAREGRTPGFRKILPLAGCALGAIACDLVVFAWWEPAGARGVMERLRLAAEAASGVQSAEPNRTGFLAAQMNHLSSLFGWGLLAMTSLGLLVIRRVSDRPVTGFAIGWLMMAMLNVAVFHKRAHDHDFWWYYLLPCVAISTASTAKWIHARVPVVCWLVCLAVLTECGLRTGLRHARQDRATPRALAAEVNAAYGPKDLLLLSASAGSWKFYAKPWVYDQALSAPELLHIVDQFNLGGLAVDRVVLDAGPEQIPPEAAAMLEARGFRRTEKGGRVVFEGRRVLETPTSESR